MELDAEPCTVHNCVLVKPDLPKQVHDIEKGTLEQNGFQKTAKPEAKLKQMKMAEAKKLELVFREAAEGRQFDKMFEKTEVEQLKFEESGQIGNHIRRHYESLTGDKAEDCLLFKTSANGQNQFNISGMKSVAKILLKWKISWAASRGRRWSQS